MLWCESADLTGDSRQCLIRQKGKTSSGQGQILSSLIRQVDARQVELTAFHPKVLPELPVRIHATCRLLAISD